MCSFAVLKFDALKLVINKACLEAFKWKGKGEADRQTERQAEM
jgi:hypothetical protein